MKTILHNMMLAALWLAGALFFFLLSFYIAVLFVLNGFRKLFRFRRKGLYHFRESEFAPLNVIYDSGKVLTIGKLPITRGETFTYHVPLAAKEILLEFKFSAYPPDTCVEFDYCISANDSTFRKEYIYIFINPFNSVKWNYDKALVWYPLPQDRILKIQFADVKPIEGAMKNIEGHLNIVQVR